MFRKAGENLNKGSPNKNDHSLRQKPLSLVELHELFIKFKLHGAGNANNSVENYKRNFELLLQFKPNIRLQDLKEETIVNFLEFLNTRLRKIGKQQIVRKYKNSSMALIRSNLNVFFNWLQERNYINTNPFEKIPHLDVSYTDKRAFAPKEFETICYAVNTKIQWTNLIIKKRNIAMIMVLVFTGIRKEELIGLQISDVDIERKFIVVRAEISKSKRHRIIPMNSILIPYLIDYFHYRRNYTSKCLWVSGTVDRGLTEHGVKHLIILLTKVTKINCHLHRFRHTFATTYYRQTHDLFGLQKLMGHRSLRMTISYLRSLPDEHLVEQIHKLSFDEFF